MTTPRPPVILSTIIASLILSLALIFISWTSPASAVHASVGTATAPATPIASETSQVQLPTPTSPDQQTAASAGPQAPIPDQPTDTTVDPANVQAADTSSVEFNSFVQQVEGGQANELRGVYVEGLFALKVVPQPAGDVGFVSTDPGTATQFQLTAPGVTGLLAHNVLDGAKFLELKPGQEIRLVYGDGSVHRYQVEGLREFQRLDRSNLQSDFIETQTGTKMTSQQVFDWFYTGDAHLTLQTCVANDGIEDWGVRFIIAHPIT